MTALSMPNEIALMLTMKKSTSSALSARLVCTLECMSASASSLIVLRQSGREMRYG